MYACASKGQHPPKSATAALSSIQGGRTLPEACPLGPVSAGCDPYGDAPAVNATLEQSEGLALEILLLIIMLPFKRCSPAWRVLSPRTCLPPPLLATATACAAWQCQFAGLPDLNYTQLEVRKKAADWLNWFIGQFGWVQSAGWVQQAGWPGLRCRVHGAGWL